MSRPHRPADAAAISTVRYILSEPGLRDDPGAKVLLVACALEGRPLGEAELAEAAGLRSGDIDQCGRFLHARGYASWRDGELKLVKWWAPLKSAKAG